VKPASVARSAHFAQQPQVGDLNRLITGRSLSASDTCILRAPVKTMAEMDRLMVSQIFILRIFPVMADLIASLGRVYALIEIDQRVILSHLPV